MSDFVNAIKNGNKKILKTLTESHSIFSKEFFNLEYRGYIVIPNVIDIETCEQLKDEILSWFENLYSDDRKIDRNNPETWSRNIPTNIHGIYQQYGVAHISPLWKLRQHPAINKLFAKLWNCPPEELIGSFDGMCVVRPPEIKKRKVGFDSGKRWYHFDQNGDKKGTHCIQGLITLEDMGSSDATLTVLKYSHRLHEEFFKNFNLRKEDWVKFTEEELVWFKNFPIVKEVRVKASAGSLVLWNSSLAHCTAPPKKGRKNHRWRFVAYQCQIPRNLHYIDNDGKKHYRTEEEVKVLIQRKQKAFNDKRNTSHWPLTFKLFSDNPRFGVKKEEINTKTIELKDLSSLGKQLAGFL